MGEQDLCWDDSDWLHKVLAPELNCDLIILLDQLADAFDPISLRTYHGCRVEDAGVFHREGLRINDPEMLAEQVRRVVAEDDYLAWMRPDLEEKIAQWDARDRDTGRLYVCLDDRPQLDYIGHYALYGSEWVSAFLGHAGRRALLLRGVPTILEIDIPMSWVRPSTRSELAAKLLQEWTRQTVNKPTWIPSLDFSIILHHDIPPEHIAAHYHPAVLKCPFSQKQAIRSPSVECPSCR